MDSVFLAWILRFSRNPHFRHAIIKVCIGSGKIGTTQGKLREFWNGILVGTLLYAIKQPTIDKELFSIYLDISIFNNNNISFVL